jgi:hypothetical protein
MRLLISLDLPHKETDMGETGQEYVNKENHVTMQNLASQK